MSNKQRYNKIHIEISPLIMKREYPSCSRQTCAKTRLSTYRISYILSYVLYYIFRRTQLLISTRQIAEKAAHRTEFHPHAAESTSSQPPT